MLKQFKPKTSSLRHTIRVKHEVTTNVPEETLLKKVKYKAAKNSQGRITVRGRGGRTKKLYRLVDFVRYGNNSLGVVKSIEYDPFRTSYISLVVFQSGKKSYILSPKDIKVGDTVVSAANAPIKIGNALQLKNIPASTFVHNVQLSPDSKGTLVRSAGTYAIVMGTSNGSVQVKLPSGEIRLINGECYATIGQLSNTDNMNQTFGKSGVLRHMGFRPIVRGVAQHPGSHPHGGGQGKAGRHGTGGPAVDPWGNKRFKKTRNNPRSDKFIVQNRKGRKLAKID